MLRPKPLSVNVSQTQGMDSRSNPIKMEPTKSAVLYNVDLSSPGKKSIRLGVTPVLSAPAAVPAMGLCYLKGGGIASRMTYITNKRFYKSTLPLEESGSWTDVPGADIFTAAQYPQAMQEAQGSVYMSNGVDNFYGYNGTSMTAYVQAPKGKVLAYFKNRLWVGNVVTTPYILGDVITYTGAAGSYLKIIVGGTTYDDIDLSSATTIDNVVTLINAVISAKGVADKTDAGYLRVYSKTSGSGVLTINNGASDTQCTAESLFGGAVTTGTVVDSCQDGWNEETITNVTSTTVNKVTESIEGASANGSCVKLTLTDVFTTGKIADEAIAVTDLSAVKYIYLWLRSTHALDASDLSFMIDEHAAQVSTDATAIATAIPADTWVRCKVDISGISAASRNAVISIGLQLNTDHNVAFSIYVDDVRSWGATTYTSTSTGYTYPDFVYHSNVIDPTTYDLTNNVFKVFSGDGTDVMAMRPFMESSLLIFKEDSIHELLVQGDTATYWNLRPIDMEHGCVAYNCTAAWGASIFYLSRDGVRVIQANTAAPELPLSWEIKSIWDTINFDYITRAKMIVHNNKLYVAVPTGTTAYNDKVLVYDLTTKGWSIYTGWNVGCFAIHVEKVIGATADEEEVLMWGDVVTGVVNKCFKATAFNDNATAIAYQEDTKRFDFDYPYKKIGDYVDFKILSGTATNVVVSGLIDGGTATVLATSTASEKLNLKGLGRFSDLQLRFATTGTSTQQLVMGEYTIFARPCGYRRT